MKEFLRLSIIKAEQKGRETKATKFWMWGSRRTPANKLAEPRVLKYQAAVKKVGSAGFRQNSPESQEWWVQISGPKSACGTKE